MTFRPLMAPLCALLALAPATAAAQQRPNKPSTFSPSVPSYSLNTKVIDLPSGLRILFQADHTHPTVGVFTIVDHGTSDDPAGKEETAHFVEHTWFRSAQLQFPSIMNFVFDYGTLFNATTRNDWTDYRTVANKKYIDTLLQLESARLTSPHKGVTEEMITVEREVIRNEWRRRNEQNEALFVDFVYETLYPADHPYHDHSTHGSIDNIKLADLQQYFDTWYHPDTTTVFVVGDFDDSPEGIINLIVKNFDLKVIDPKLTEDHLFRYPAPDREFTYDPDGDGVTEPDPNNRDDWHYGLYAIDSDPADPNRAFYNFTAYHRPEPRLTPANRQEPPPVGSKEVVTRQGPFKYKTVTIAWSLPGGFREDAWNIQSVGNTLNQYIANGLRDRINNKQIGDVFCFALQEKLATTVVCGAELLDKKLDPLDVRDDMMDQISEMWNPENLSGTGTFAPIYNIFLERAKLDALADMLLNLDLYAQVFGGRAETIVPYAHYNSWEESGRAFSAGMEAFNAIEAQTISDLAFKYLRRDRVATVVLEPLPEDEIDVGSEKSSYSGSNVTDTTMTFSEKLEDFTPERIAGDYVVPDLTELVDYKLENGMRVVILPRGVAPVVHTSLILGRDADSEAKGLLGFSQAFAESIGNDPLPIATQVSWGLQAPVPGLWPGKGYPLDTYTRAGAITMDARSPSGNLDGALWLLREEMETAHTAFEGNTAYMKRRRTSLEKDWKDPEWHIGNYTSAFLYPDAPSRQSMTWEEITEMGTWGPDRVTDYLAMTLQPANATLLIVGDVTVADVKKDVETYFAGWQPRKGAPPPPAHHEPPGMSTADSKILVFDDAKRTQSDVTMYCRLSLQGTPDEDLAVGLLSSLMGDRIFHEIRVKRGLAYSPGAGAGIQDDGAGRVAFYSDGVVNSGAGEILQYYKQVVDEVHSGRFDPNELLATKIRTARSDGLAWQSTAQAADNLAELIIDGKPFDTVATRGEKIANVTVEQVSHLLDSCAERTLVTIEGPKDIVGPQLDELGYAYEVVDWRANGEDLLWKYDPKQAKEDEKARLKAEKKKAKEAAKSKPEDASADAPAPSSPH